MPQRPGGRAATKLAAAAALVVGLAACGTPPDLDRDEQLAFARACASLIERNLSDNKLPRVAVLDNEDINLDDPAAFYALLERLRGASTFNLHDPKRSTDTARQPLDDCSTKAKVLSSLLGPRLGGTTSTTTTTTTVPGS